LHKKQPTMRRCLENRRQIVLRVRSLSPFSITSLLASSSRLPRLLLSEIMMTTGGVGLRRGSVCCFHASFHVPDTPLGRSNSKYGDIEFLESRLQLAGVAKIAFLRHGKTAPAKNGVDFDRLLTDEGRQQAKDSGRIMAKHLVPFYPRCLVSPAPRTMETAQLFF
jgi:Histidine phosphatase superfamily (branch 1)